MLATSFVSLFECAVPAHADDAPIEPAKRVVRKERPYTDEDIKAGLRAALAGYELSGKWESGEKIAGDLEIQMGRTVRADARVPRLPPPLRPPKDPLPSAAHASPMPPGCIRPTLSAASPSHQGHEGLHGLHL